MSVECAECEMDLRAGHALGCSRFPFKIDPTGVNMDQSKLLCRVREEEGDVVGPGAIVEIMTGPELLELRKVVRAAGGDDDVPTTHVVVKYIDGEFRGEKLHWDRAQAKLGFYAFTAGICGLQPLTPAAAWHLAKVHWGEDE